MNLINRVIILLGLIVVLVLVTVLCLFPRESIQQLVAFAGWLEGIEPRIMLQDRLILIAIAVVVDLVLIFLIFLELRRPEPKSVRIQRVEGGTALLSSDSIQKRLAFYIDGLSEVVNVKPKVQVKKDTVKVAVDVQTAANVDLPSKAREIVSVIRMVVTETMGLRLHGEPQVNIRTGSYKKLPLPEAAAEQKQVVEEVVLPQETAAVEESDLVQEGAPGGEEMLPTAAVLEEE